MSHQLVEIMVGFHIIVKQIVDCYEDADNPNYQKNVVLSLYQLDKES